MSGESKVHQAAAEEQLMKWMKEAEEAIKKVPFFVRKKVKARVEKEAGEAGKPVVSVPIPDIIEFYENYIEITGDYESFVGAIDRVLTSPDHEKLRSGLRLSKTKSWRAMVDTMLKRVLEQMK